MMTKSKHSYKSGAYGRVQSLIHQQGVGMVEILIALMILSIGFLGVAALQVVSLSNNNSSMSRSIATISTYSILDAMRADRTNALGGSYNIAMPNPIPGNCTQSGSSLANEQLSFWRNEIQQNMGSTACGSVACNAGLCRIEIQFDDSRASGGSSTQTLITEVFL